jgi:hypothetical protein
MGGGGGGWKYSSTLSLTTALEGGGVVNVIPRPLYPWEREPVPINSRLVGSRAALDMCGKYRHLPLPLPGIPSTDRPARSESLYRLSNPGPVYRFELLIYCYPRNSLCRQKEYCFTFHLLCDILIKCGKNLTKGIFI